MFVCMQVSALLNSPNAQSDRELVRVLNAIRKEQGSVDPEMRQRVFGVYNLEILSSNAGTAQFVNSVPIAGAPVDFLLWLFDEPGLE